MAYGKAFTPIAWSKRGPAPLCDNGRGPLVYGVGDDMPNGAWMLQTIERRADKRQRRERRKNRRRRP